MRKEPLDSKAHKKLNYLKGKGEFNHDDYLQSEEMKDVYSFVQHWSNWKEGKYTIFFEIDSPEAFILKDNIYEFSLNQLNIESLEANKDLIMLSYEDIIKSGINGYEPHKLTWNWVNRFLKKAKEN